ncbi:hypothetical protein GOP47_0021807 [Adiantum capillus-veneris]|uniref:NADP-dependent oxidoreductase domain-containing protein n=1 Tax=Adiantum capillus-veneris TaxID=13818 RepID=A0A9D4U8E5_ADICA|nr:hypothetical protein GOP47_0021807 [Adiantum capillus-veneris]
MTGAALEHARARLDMPTEGRRVMSRRTTRLLPSPCPSALDSFKNAMETPAFKTVHLGSQGLQVSAQGLGCMGMSFLYGPPKPELEMIDLIHHVVDSGITFLDTSDVYGPFTNEILLGKALKGIRHKVQLATKFGVKYDKGQFDSTIYGDPTYVRAACEASLKRLDVDYIDLYYQNRVDTKVPIEVTVGEMKKLVEEGKVKYIGLSEASASTIRRAHAIHPISAVQMEYSLWSRDVEKDIIPTCRELGIGIVAYSPLGRGFFSAGEQLLEGTTETDYRKIGQPRMEGGNLEKNQRLFHALQALASIKGCTSGQLALAWDQHQGDDIVPIPGTTRIKNFEENVGALKVKLSKAELQEIEVLFEGDATAGDRYEDMSMWTYENGDTPPLSAWEAS